MNKVIIAGCGYLGQRLALAHQQRGDQVLGLVRSLESQHQLQELGLQAQCLDLDSPEFALMPSLDECLLYWLVPPPPSGEHDSRSAAFIRLLGSQKPRRLVLISTTGVYGDCAGAWVDEQRPPNPQVPRALRRHSAERQWRRWADAAGVKCVCLRLPGIYGPGRLPRARLEKGLPMLCEAEAPWSNRIHVDDLTEVCLRAMSQAELAALYNVSDSHPSTMLDYFNRLADLLGLPRPPQISRRQAEAQLSAEMMSYLSESRRIDNRNMLRDLQLQLRYPSLAEGLPAAVAAEQGR
ncbi:MAG: SDR family oxidoreductase [Gammaproteobacteria bacterium]|nr:SDR family oxidoreductase [Gammaproteobacteria bacterium]